ncbi:MAG: short-chain dehydrogenase [Spirochaetes bacterium GWF1_41_5]|nr:MAG: short-chain dehydrogenase [Spirochaetes bacterium GWF1_41_5]HBE02508.1 short-chain dehydrogenase [Spirochaetia bacterium]
MVHNFFDLSGKRAAVTGASRGLGQYFARALARAGADIIITSRKKEDCLNFCREIESLGRKVQAYDLDVQSEESIKKFAAAVLADYGYIDILVNNAGCNRRKPAMEVTWDDWNTILNTNLRGTFFMCQAFGASMIKRGYGRIINIGSVTCVFGYAGLVPYSASRGGVAQLTKALADDWGKFGITVNCLAPGWFKTEQNKILYENEAWVEYICDRIPLKRPGRPDDLDGSVIFLASDAGRYITGQVLLIDGGISTGATKATL